MSVAATTPVRTAKGERTAERILKRARFPSSLISRLRKSRGMKVVIELAARLQGASREDVRKMEKVISQSLEGGELETPSFPRGYLRKALENLAEVYRTPGIETLLPEDLERIEARMAEVVSEGYPFVRREVDRAEAEELFADDHLKLERLAEIPEGETISTYTDGPFIDLCRGPHVASTAEIEHFKLLSGAGA